MASRSAFGKGVDRRNSSPSLGFGLHSDVRRGDLKIKRRPGRRSAECLTSLAWQNYMPYGSSSAGEAARGRAQRVRSARSPYIDPKWYA
eukprot:6185983-Pleurochrysis_carterae.AAC.3